MDKKILPALILEDTVFPYETSNFVIKTTESDEILNAVASDDGVILIVKAKDSQYVETTPSVLSCYAVGTICNVKRTKKTDCWTMTGIKRAKITDFEVSRPSCVEVEELEYVNSFNPLIASYFNVINSIFDEYFKLENNREIKNLATRFRQAKDNDEKINVVLTGVAGQQRQHVLEMDDSLARAELAAVLMKEALDDYFVMKRVENIVNERIEQGQRNYVLRERIKAIKSELGEDEDDIDVYRDKIEKLNACDKVKSKLRSDVSKMEKLPTSAPEYSVLCNYMDTALSLPWDNYGVDDYDVAKAAKILDEDHYGIEKVKQRILEYIAVKKLAPEIDAPILCLVGPPGVGKTSIARSIARAVNKELVQMSLGGMKDESEIRGHRRTYVGAMPGRIIHSLCDIKYSNPLFLLDEVDKIGSGINGDPSSALLEVLDPKQNKYFRDNYLEIPYDLSKVTFIITANTLNNIQQPLLDRMEVIEMSGYTQEEKIEIAKRYLVPAQIKNNGLSGYDVEFDDLALTDVIERYTSEAGVRELERQIGAICRKIAVKIADSQQDCHEISFVVRQENLKDYLGVPKFDKNHKYFDKECGVVNGLAWTSVGGVVMNIESKVLSDGKGEMILTGNLGDVMKESAKIALTVVKNKLSNMTDRQDNVKHGDIHIHAPEGATPKDGPSAGIAIACSLLSAYTSVPVDNDVAMTGELTLSGKVLPIGGLKEKLLACVRNGINNVIIPEQNNKDLDEMPDVVKEKLKINAVSNVEQVFNLAFGGRL
ncbi:MAG: endopeptidase La [Christensenellales bacterium]